MPADMATMEREVKKTALMLIKGLRTAPTPTRTAPCAVVIPVLLHVFRTIVADIAALRAVPEASVVRSFGDLLDVLVTFANSTWTTEEIALFESCTCRHHSADCFQEFHRELSNLRNNGEAYNYKPWREIIVQVFHILASVARLISNDDTGIVNLAKKRNRGKWPSSLSQFTPHGPAIALSAFMEWARLAEHPAPLHALCQISSCSPSLCSAMNEDHNILPLYDTLFNHYIAQLQRLDFTNISVPVVDMLEQDIHTYRDVFDCSWFCGRENLSMVTQDDAHTYNSLYLAICDLIPLLKMIPFLRASEEDLAIMFGCAALAIHLFLSRFAPVPMCSVLEPFVPMHKRSFSPYTMLLTTIALRNQPDCAERSCFRTGEQTKTNFKACARCQAVRYCSKECQVVDWKEHKKVCKLLKVVTPMALIEYREVPGLVTPEKMNNFYDKVKRAGITEEDMMLMCMYINNRGEAPQQRSIVSPNPDWQT